MKKNTFLVLLTLLLMPGLITAICTKGDIVGIICIYPIIAIFLLIIAVALMVGPLGWITLAWLLFWKTKPNR